ncbi:hypothetical protein SK128_001214 [Halocaridina rubra]|uniref:Uncharacterized protein n=1 Tax=Halocaridina rubra TaxID=373956 RepID=A0AAN8WSS2_HALRR
MCHYIYFPFHSAVQSERKPNSVLGSSDRRDKEGSPPVSLANPFPEFEQSYASCKTPIVGKDIPSQPPTTLAELHLQMAKAFEGAFCRDGKEQAYVICTKEGSKPWNSYNSLFIIRGEAFAELPTVTSVFVPKKNVKGFVLKNPPEVSKN